MYRAERQWHRYLSTEYSPASSWWTSLPTVWSGGLANRYLPFSSTSGDRSVKSLVFLKILSNFYLLGRARPGDSFCWVRLFSRTKRISSPDKGATTVLFFVNTYRSSVVNARLRLVAVETRPKAGDLQPAAQCRCVYRQRYIHICPRFDTMVRAFS